MKQPKVELLAPASGLEAIRGAIFAGADAVYTGGTRFGARAYADNLAEDELLQAIDFVHLHAKQLYLTVNTLLNEKELEHALVDYLKPYYEQGLDAVIVQDVGVFRTVKEHFPDLPIHVSTQAVVTGKNSARLWEEMGAQRIVTARELSLKEIQEIRDNISIEIESFVHGALCYCYSGQCLFSSFLGGRSGNRGRCAQPCRLPYELTDEDGRVLSKGTCGSNGNEQYLLSPKDMCTLDILPDIIEAGVFSLKIEGRMKRPEYTAGVTEIYRKYVDLYLRCKEAVEQSLYHGRQKNCSDKKQDILQMIKEQYRVSPEDKERLMDLYNRGNFHSGYYVMHNGKEMMSMERPNHNGVYAGTMKKGKKGYSMKAETDLCNRDVLEFRGVADKKKNGEHLELNLERNVRAGEVYVLPEKYTFLLGKRQLVPVYRTKKEQLLQELHRKYLEEEKQLAITGQITVIEGQKLSLTVSDVERTVMVTGETVDTAQNQPATKEDILKQTKKTGNTPFVFEALEAEVKGRCFVSVKALKQLRRDALEQLEKAIVTGYRRDAAKSLAAGDAMISTGLDETDISKSYEAGTISAKKSVGSSKHGAIIQPKCHVSIEELHQLPAVLSFEQVDAVYISIHACSLLEDVTALAKDNEAGKVSNEEASLQHLIQVKNQCHEAGKRMYLVLPHIWRRTVEQKLEPFMERLLQEIDGIVVKNMEALAFVNIYKPTIDVVLDYTAYTMNSKAALVWKENGATMLTVPVELNKGEVSTLTANHEAIEEHGQADEWLPWEMIVYGHLPMMVSAQCPVKNTIGCQKRAMITRLKDRKGSRHYVKNYCDACYNVIYNSEPLVLTDLKEELSRLNISVHRLQFTVETEEKIKQVLSMYLDGGEPDMAYTRGHWKRGVE